MDLWIRSQDKTKLLKINGLYINIINDFNSGGFGIYIQSELSKTNFERLGIYSTKERVLEILDEITNILEQEEFFHIRKSALNNLDDIAEPKYILNPVGQPKVYKMPIE